MGDFERDQLSSFLDALGVGEEPMGMHYTDIRPDKGFSPKEGVLPTAEDEKKGLVDFGALFGNFSCVIVSSVRSGSPGGRGASPTSTASISAVWEAPFISGS